MVRGMRATARASWNLDALSLGGLVVGLTGLLGAFVVPGLEGLALAALAFLVPGLLLATR